MIRTFPAWLVLSLSACVGPGKSTCGPGQHRADGVCVDDAQDSQAGDDSAVEGEADVTVCATGGDFTRLQDAIDAVPDGTTIGLCAGVFDGAILDGRAVDLIGLEGAALTRIDGGDGTALRVLNTPAAVLLRGLTLTGLSSGGTPAALDAQGAELSLEDVDVTACTSRDSRSHPAVLFEGSTVRIEGGRFYENALRSYVIRARQGGSFTLRHAVFSDNQPPGAGVGGLLLNIEVEGEVANNLFINNRMGGEYVSLNSFETPEGALRVVNNTFARNTNQDGFHYGVAELGPGGQFENNIAADNGAGGVTRYTTERTEVHYNDSWENNGSNWGELVSGTGNLELDPRFTDPENGDFTLDPSASPCVDAGNPQAGDNDTDGSRNDLGAFGGPGGGW